MSLIRTKNLIPERLVPFAEDGGGDFFCLNRRAGAVVYYTRDDCLEPATAAKAVAGSLAELIEDMVSEEEALRRAY